MTWVVGPEHLLSLIIISNLEKIYASLGAYEVVLKHVDTALLSMTKVLGQIHPGTLRAKECIASIYLN